MNGDTPFNVVLAETRESRGMSVGECAVKTGFTRSFIRAYEEVAVNPTVQTMFKFAQALGLRFVIDANGVTIIDTETDVTILENWKLNARATDRFR